MSDSTVGNDGTWTAKVDNAFRFELSNDGDKILDGNLSLGSIDIGTKDNHISLGGGSQEFKWDGSLSYGKTTVNVLGGSFDLGDGRTDDFQFSFTAEPTPLGLQWTGVATNTLTETHSFGMSAQDVLLKHESEAATLEKKHPLFDVAGVIIPRSVFTGWATLLQFTVGMDVAIDNAEHQVTATVTRTLTLEVRPVFTPFPETRWPARPQSPPWLDRKKEAVRELAQRQAMLRVLIQFVDAALHEVHTWQRIQPLIDAVNFATAAVAAATVAFAAAAGIAAFFVELNPVADAAEIETGLELAAATAELTTEKLALKAEECLLAWGCDKITARFIVSQAAACLPVIAAAIVAGTALSAEDVSSTAQAYFKTLATECGLDVADAVLDALADGLTRIRTRLVSDLDATTHALQTATVELREASALATKLLEYQLLLESWTADPQHAPFLTWPNTNLRISNTSEDAEVVVVGDIDAPDRFAAAAANMEAHASDKGYNGFVMIPHEQKAYFRRRDVAGLLSTIDNQPYAKGMVSYVRAEQLPMNVVVDRWAAIFPSNQA